jgi:TIR domain
MEFEGDAFISYAHLDNVELVEGRKGWVANLHRALEVRVAQLLGKSPHIWRDPKLQGNDLFAEALVEKLRHVAVLVTVVSPRYIQSEWTMRELKAFWTAAEEQGGIRVGDKARVFKILKTPIPLDKTPPELRMLLGYEFFKIDPESGRVRELDEVFGPDAQRDFWIKLDDLAHDVVALLEALHAEAYAATAADLSGGSPGAPKKAPASMPSPAPAAHPSPHAAHVPETKGTIFLAETTSDLKDQRESLRRDLLEHGYAVLPAQPLPHVAREAEAIISENLGRSRLSVHMIGRSYSLVPEGATQSLIELQHELATERARDERFSRLLWLPDGLEVADERQAHLIERLRLDPRIQDRADFLETMFEDLRTTVHDWLTREPVPASRPGTGPSAGPIPQVYLIADQRDADLIHPWADALFDQRLEVIRPLFDGEESGIREYHEENLTICDGVLIFYGAGNELWLQRKLRELQKAPGYGRTKPRPVVGVCLIGVRSPDKERFRSHEASVIPQWDGVSLPALQPFIAQLKAGRPV